MELKSVITTQFDKQFKLIDELAWRPWVGKNYEASESPRILIVGESHYDKPDKKYEFGETPQSWKDYTREIILESCINNDWSASTYENVQRLLHGNSKVDRCRYWSDISYYNIVQRIMDGTKNEQPSTQDFEQGWKAFVEVVKVLKPDHCLFIGVAASNHFNDSMTSLKQNFDGAVRMEKVGRYVPRTARIRVDDLDIPITFVKHAGSYFSWQSWRAFLQRQCPEMMKTIADRNYSTSAPQTTHILGMAKSSLDLKGAKASKLELDFLKLAYTAKNLIEDGDEVYAYLLILTDKFQSRIKEWIKKYNTGDVVKLIICTPSNNTLELLHDEKLRNSLGVTSKSSLKELNKLSCADIGKQTGEQALHDFIQDKHKEIKPYSNYNFQGISWDYYACSAPELDEE